MRGIVPGSSARGAVDRRTYVCTCMQPFLLDWTRNGTNAVLAVGWSACGRNVILVSPCGWKKPVVRRWVSPETRTWDMAVMRHQRLLETAGSVIA